MRTGVGSKPLHGLLICGQFETTTRQSISAPGLWVDVRAERDVLVVVSNCPQINNPCNGFDPTPVRMVVTAPEEEA